MPSPLPVPRYTYVLNRLTSNACIDHCQDAAIEARDVIFSRTSLPGGGSQTGAVASVFEAIARRCPENTPDPWTKDINKQRRLVVATRRVLGLDWSYKVDCNVPDHNQRHTTPDQTATCRDATIITTPEAQASSIGEKSRNSSSHREHRTFRYKGKPSAHTVQRTSPSPCVTGPCCHVIRVTHQTNFLQIGRSFHG